MKAILTAAAAALLCAAPAAALEAGATTTIFGNGAARDCADGAIAGGKSLSLLEICTKAIDFEDLPNADLAKTYVNRAVINLRLSAIEDSRRDLLLAEQRDATIPEIHINRGALYLRERRYKDAIDEINRGLAMNPTEPEKAYFDRALAREQTGDIRGAYFDYLKASELNPKWEQPAKELARFTVKREGAAAASP